MKTVYSYLLYNKYIQRKANKQINKKPMISIQDERFLSAAYKQAENSPVLMRHGAITVINGKIIGRGYNNYRTYSSDEFIKDTCTCHAEITALRSTYTNYSTNAYGKYSDNIKGF